jgi:hypothetical protein
MAHGTTHSTSDIVDCRTVALIVVGAHLRAEIEDRPQAYRLRDRLRDWTQLHDQSEAVQNPSLVPVVCTDIWFLNNFELQERPVICLGEPGVNAATAFLCTRLPTALMVEGALRVHLDPDFAEAQVCLWGVNPPATASAVDLFIERYLEVFMAGAIDM